MMAALLESQYRARKDVRFDLICCMYHAGESLEDIYQAVRGKGLAEKYSLSALRYELWMCLHGQREERWDAGYDLFADLLDMDYKGVIAAVYVQARHDLLRGAPCTLGVMTGTAQSSHLGWHWDGEHVCQLGCHVCAQDAYRYLKEECGFVRHGRARVEEWADSVEAKYPFIGLRDLPIVTQLRVI